MEKYVLVNKGNISKIIDTIINETNPDINGIVIFKDIKLHRLSRILKRKRIKLDYRLPLVITKKHIYTDIRTNGIIKGKNVNYHSIGKDRFIMSLTRINNPNIIFKTKRGIVEAITIKDIHNNPIIITIILGEKIYNTNIEANIISSIYGKKSFIKYITGKEIIYKKVVSHCPVQLLIPLIP